MDIFRPSSRPGSTEGETFLDSIIKGMRQEFSSSDNMSFTFLNRGRSRSQSPSMILSCASSPRHPRVGVLPYLSPMKGLRGGARASPNSDATDSKNDLSGGALDSPNSEVTDSRKGLCGGSRSSPESDVKEFKDSLSEKEILLPSPKMFVRNSPKPRKFNVPTQVVSLKEMWLNNIRMQSENDIFKAKKGKLVKKFGV